MEALQTATLRVVAVIAEGVPEKDTKRMIAFARANNKVIIGPATVGGVQVGEAQHLVQTAWQLHTFPCRSGRHAQGSSVYPGEG
jgi:succinyl-CoA synthetase alpha subunit